MADRVNNNRQLAGKPASEPPALDGLNAAAMPLDLPRTTNPFETPQFPDALERTFGRLVLPKNGPSPYKFSGGSDNPLAEPIRALNNPNQQCLDFAKLNPTEQREVLIAAAGEMQKSGELIPYRKLQLNLLLQACEEMREFAANPRRTNLAAIKQLFNCFEAEINLGNNVEKFLNTESPSAVERTNREQLVYLVENGATLKDAIDEVVSQNSDDTIRFALYKVSDLFSLDNRDLPDNPLLAEEKLKEETAKLISKMRGRDSYSQVEFLSFAALESRLDSLVTETLSPTEIRQVEEEARKYAEELSQRTEKAKTEIIKREYPEKSAEDIKQLFAQQKELLIATEIQGRCYRLALSKLGSMLGDSEAKSEFIASLTPAERKVWDEYNEAADPTNEWFNLSDSNVNFLTEELAINLAIAAVSMGMGNATVGGLRLLGQGARWAGTKVAVQIGAEQAGKTLAREVGGRMMAKFGQVAGEQAVERLAIWGSRARTAGGVLNAATDKLINNAISSHIQIQLDDVLAGRFKNQEDINRLLSLRDPERLVENTLSLSALDLAGSVAGSKMARGALARLSFAERPAFKRLVAGFESSPNLKAALEELAKSADKATPAIARTASETTAVLTVEALRRGYYNGSPEDIVAAFEPKELFQALTYVGGVKISRLLYRDRANKLD